MADSRMSKNNFFSINKAELYWSFALSIILLIISIFFGNIFQFISGYFVDGGQNANFGKALEHTNKLWFYPVLAYFVFVGCIMRAKNELDKKLREGILSRTEITKIIDKWSGIVDGIGTALPLIGAAVILFTIGLGKESQNLFLEFAVPFEIKSLFILAIARLFESAFDDLEIQYLGTVSESIPENIKDLRIDLPDSASIAEMNDLLSNLNETVQNMKDPKFEKTIESIMKITGK